eukprot:9924_1
MAAADNQLLRHVLTIVFSVLAGIAFCATIVGILWGAGVLLVHLGECAVAKPPPITPPPTTDSVIKTTPPAPFVYRHSTTDAIFVTFLKVKKSDGGLYDDYLVNVFINGGRFFGKTIQASELPTQPATNPVFANCPGTNAYHSSVMCFAVSVTTKLAGYKFNYQPIDAESNPVADLVSKKSKAVVGFSSSFV